ncbi:MAG: hypothetical protein A2X25_00955 [Chloroflexi bacterium GWB2_49_20]|nr:MAG: hypothetical protein A2X25_00955 [Chloroflexi bacterium GWB2_49_20]OGN77520.1 MAG: hypothetical protein A2X26_02145 [Chloroflexi bacterium GWC2_49_37]OGN83217.1 MAG: hypothetical protein A2X27_13575 [Chloroflexi bacterium GWD2_49_16]
MNLLAVINGDYGQRHVDNIRKHAPPGWRLEVWQAPRILPQVIDYPEDYLPESLPPSDLVLAFGEHKGVAELIPDVAHMCGAKAVIAGIDNEAVLPRGLARQLRGWLERMGVVCVTPKPLCSLTETEYSVTRREKVTYSQPLISEFARYFGRPKLKLTLDPETRIITSAEVSRDTVCGCARYTAERLVGISADDAEQEAGMLHHHYPCLAAMGIDSDFGDTLMHVSGNILRDEVAEQVKPYRRIQYIAPGLRSDDPPEEKK